VLWLPVLRQNQARVLSLGTCCLLPLVAYIPARVSASDRQARLDWLPRLAVESLSRQNPDAARELRANGYAFQGELNYRVWMLGYAITEVPIIFTERSAGQSKMSAGIVREAIWRTSKLGLQHLVSRKPKDSTTMH
jgi:hypothetical protein